MSVQLDDKLGAGCIESLELAVAIQRRASFYSDRDILQRTQGDEIDLPGVRLLRWHDDCGRHYAVGVGVTVVCV
jgi:hypothetical protein